MNSGNGAKEVQALDLTAAEWRVSLHGGHSGEFCDHAQSTLREMLDAAVAEGFHTFGVSEHVPRPVPFLYPEERARGWTAEKVADDFERYTVAISTLAEEFAGRLIVLRGYEAEVVPTASYVTQMRAFRHRTLPDGRPAFDYFVGSVHYVDEQQIDGPPENFIKAIQVCGGIEALAIRYYDTITEMVEVLRPDVIGHLDLIKKNLQPAGYATDALETPAVYAAVDRALAAVRANDGILDLNTAGWRKGLGEPYPAPWLVRHAHEMQIPFCIGDDSHRPADVGAGVDAARAYLLANGVPTVTVITREGDVTTGAIVRRTVSLLATPTI